MNGMIQLLGDWRRASEEIIALVDKLPRVIGNIAVKEVKNNFTIQGYDSGAGVQQWEPRKDSTNKRYTKRYGVKGSVFQADNKILLQTRNLYNAIRYKATKNSVTIGVNLDLVPYAKIHNEGGQGNAFGKASFTMPKRQFMPMPSDTMANPKIMAAAGKKIIFERDRILKKFNL
jgi:phage gpG-like protein